MVDASNMASKGKKASRAERDRKVAEWSRAARDLDAKAEALLLRIPSAVAVLEVFEARPVVVHERTRGPRQAVLREIAASVVRRHPEPQRLHRAADALYWQMVMVFERSMRLDARSKATRWSLDEDDVYQTILEGWYKAAVRFEGERGLSLYTSAQHYARVALQRSGLLGAAGVFVPLAVATGPNPPKLRTLTFDVVVGRGDGDDPTDKTLRDLLTTDGTLADQHLHPSMIAVPGEIGGNEYRDRAHARALVATLPARERRVLTLRYLNLEGVQARDITPDGLQRLERVGEQMGGICRERVRQLEVRALARLRENLTPVPTGRVARMTA